MDNTIFIKNESGTVEAEIAPDYGGMLVRLQICGRDVLYLDEDLLKSSPVKAGGMPILFPFPGRTGKETYEVNGKKYCMPMHGLVKNRTFAVGEQRSDSVMLWVKDDDAVRDRNYPYQYKLEIFYQIIKETLVIKALIRNNSDKEMPHYIGWHPYFKASKRKDIVLDHCMTIQYDYVNKKELKAPSVIDLTKDLDDVFCKPEKNEYLLVNKSDGFSVRCKMDEAYQCIVVYNGTAGSVCVEPWCGIPDAIHADKMVEWIPPAQQREYTLEMKLGVDTV